jgi:hypothetical protein
MVRMTTPVALAFAATLPMSVQAEPGSVAADNAYCWKLSDLYVRYIGHDNGSNGRLVLRGSNDAQVASTQCESNAAQAIPVLEQQLAANKFTLPPRD